MLLRARLHNPRTRAVIIVKGSVVIKRSFLYGGSHVYFANVHKQRSLDVSAVAKGSYLYGGSHVYFANIHKQRSLDVSAVAKGSYLYGGSHVFFVNVCNVKKKPPTKISG